MQLVILILSLQVYTRLLKNYSRRQVIYILVHIYIEVENETRGFFENSLVTRKLFDSLRKIKHSILITIVCSIYSNIHHD